LDTPGSCSHEKATVLLLLPPHVDAITAPGFMSPSPVVVVNSWSFDQTTKLALPAAEQSEEHAPKG
jgi:hypothetical protein